MSFKIGKIFLKEKEMEKPYISIIKLIGIASIVCFLYCTTHTKSTIDYVNPFICTQGDHGHQHPGAVVPWGMVKLGPDTYPSSLTGNGNWAHSGYNYSDNEIRGFSHLRIVGSGGTKIYDREWLISLLPIVGNPEITPEKCVAPIDKQSETAKPGFYHVVLNDHKIQADLTSTKHCGFHKYTFPKSNDAHIIIKTGSGFKIAESTVSVVSSDELSGTINKIIYFHIKFNKPFKSFSVWDENIHSNQKEIGGKRIGVILDFETEANEVILSKVGISTVSIDQARKNLEDEVPDWNFNSTAQRAKEAWEKVLNKVVVEGDEEYKEIFYTHLYHSYQTPEDVTDVNGKYTGTDKQIHIADGYTHYDNYAFWDDYRTKYPLLTLTQPDIFRDIIKSILDIYDQGWDYWPYMTCRHEHMLTAVVDGYVKGILDFDLEKAYQGIRDEVVTCRTIRREQKKKLARKMGELGYIPTRPDLTMECSYDYWCVAQMAQALGHDDDYRGFIKRARNYQNVWDSTATFWRGEAENIYGFFRARAEDGQWLEFPHDPRVIDEKYVYEGSMWQWRWFVPHDVSGLINLIGGREKFVHDLDYFFSHDLYNQGNQPDLHAPFLFNYAGAPWLTQKYVRHILTEPMTQYFGTHEFFDKPIHDRIFKSTPDGYLREMDDDYGCMAAWYVLSAMGLYQVCPGQPIYQLTAPIFKKVTLNLDTKYYPGEQFIIIAKDLSSKNIYIQSALLNKKPYNKPWITHQDIVKGGELLFEMGPKPNENWGSSPDVAPPSILAIK